MAKTRAQRKAERRKREQQAARQAAVQRDDDSRAQHATQVPESADVAEAEVSMATGATPDEVGERVRGEPADGEAPSAPAPSRADVGAPEAPAKESRRERKRREREEARQKEERRRAREAKRRPAEAPERQRGAVVGFIASCWAELRRVQWPNRDTLIQASAVTVLFVAVAAAYLGALDAAFNWIVQRLL